VTLRLRREPGAPPVSAAAGRRRDPWRAGFFVALALALLGAAAWAVFGPILLVVRHQEVTGNHLVPAAEVVAAAGIRPGTPLVSVDTAAAARRVEQIAQVLTATVSRSWPDAVVISVRERIPALAVPAGGGFALIDGDGVTVGWAARRPAALPVLKSPPAQLHGNSGIRAAVTVLGKLPRPLRQLIQAVSAPAPATVTFWLRGGTIVLWGGAGQTPAKAAELSVLLRTGARYYDVSDPAAAVTQG
jgi:cell division protein FtsQ